LTGGFDLTTFAGMSFFAKHAADTQVQVAASDMPSTLTGANGTVYTFAFVNISGSASPPQTSFDNAGPVTFLVGSSTVVLVVYVSATAAGQGISVDAFDVTRGTLVDDDFVNVATDGVLSLELTAAANVDGWFVTAPANTSLYGLTAASHLTASDADFAAWHDILDEPASPPAGDTGAQTAGDVSLLAFYNATPATGRGPREPGSIQKEIILEGPGGVIEVMPGDAPGAPIVFTQGPAKPERK
jgi:hypothetical protein